jgi:pilus assembly protein CpaC
MNSSKKILILILAVAVLTSVSHGQAQQAGTQAPLQAQEPQSQAAPAQPQQENAPTEGQTLHILVGKSVVINVQAPMTRVLSSNPAAVETLATSPTQIVVEGKAAGNSSLILWDQSGRSQMLDVVVDVDVTGLRSAIDRAYPNQHIDVQADGGKLILSGVVSDPHAVEDLTKMAALYSPTVVNSLSLAVSHDPQVLLEVRFAEVDRSRIDSLGFNIFSTGAANTLGTVSTQQFGPPGLTGSGGTVTGSKGSLGLSGVLNIFAFRPDIDLGATIQDLQTRSVLQILAQPNLLAMNGQKASFLSGGEFPFPVVQGGANVGAVTIQFRPFGVRLDFLATIDIAQKVIRLHVAPEVSTLDFTNSVSISGFTVPALSTRRAETEIELKDGQSFGIAGLIDRREQAQLNKIPGIGDIPVLGQLFRSKNLNRSNSELMVLVTPHIVDPVHKETAKSVEPKGPIAPLESPKFDKNLDKTTSPGTPR